MKIGRNDPCPCGSGLKYKNCCMVKDRDQRIRESVWIEDEQVVIDRMLAFARRPAFTPQIIVASNLFWNGNYGIEAPNSLRPDDITRFLDWYVYDYRFETNGKRPVEMFLEELGGTLLPEQRENVRIWQSTHEGLYRITAISERSTVTVLDVLEGGQQDVWIGGLNRLARVGDVAIGRILPTSGVAHFTWAVTLLPASMEAGFKALMDQAYAQYRETQPQATYGEFLSQQAYLFNHYLLRTGSAATEPLPSPYYDIRPALQILEQVTRRQQERAAKELEERRKAAEQQAQQQRSPAPDFKRTDGGILLPGGVDYRRRGRK